MNVVMQLQSIDDASPREEGGSIARSGFNYQDEIAVGIFIDMLKSSNIVKIHCETHDDIVVVRALDGAALRCAEYVQVKANAPDKLWSIGDLCARKKNKIVQGKRIRSAPRFLRSPWPAIRI